MPENFPASKMPHVKLTDLPEEELDLDASDIGDFEFSFSDPVNVIPADELFANGKLFPVNNPATSVTPEVKSDTRRIINGVSAIDSFLYSPKAPKCSSRWKELLGLKKLYQSTKTTSSQSNRSSNGDGNVATRSIKQLLNRSSKSSPTIDSSSSVNLPLLNDTDNELLTPSSSSRLSHSSSSSDDVHRLSLDSDKPAKQNLNSNSNPSIRPAMKTVKTRTLSSDGSGFGSGSGSGAGSMRLVSMDSPRMNSSGKIVFHCLERSSSSPSTFNGGSRVKNRGLMKRSHSATVRFTPVLNVPVPVCSIRGTKFSNSSSSKNGVANKSKSDRC